jgi:hypothetical protein
MVHPVSPAPAFVTDSLGLAAFLKARGHDPTPQAATAGRVMFVFAHSPELDADLAAFTQNNATVDPIAYDAARLALRRRIDTVLGSRR